MRREYKNMNIAIWGTGNIGKYVFEKIKNNENYNVRYFVDRNEKLWGNEIEGIEIISPKHLQKVFSPDIAFLLVAFSNAISIYDELAKMKLARFGIVRNRVFEAQLKLSQDLLQDKNILWSDAPYLDKPMLKSLETNVVDYCNLNCRGCSHFSNLFNSGEKVPYDIFCKDIKRIAEYVYIYQLNLLGGEVLLEERICDYVRYARKMLPDSEIQLISNGLLIPKQTDDFFECCRENNILISISGYQPTLLLKEKIIELLKQKRVVFSFRNEVAEFGKNIDLTGSADRLEAVKRCRESKCHFLRYGRIYKCPFEALGNKCFEYYGLDVRVCGGYDIYEDDLDWRMLTEKLSNHPVEACKYCGEEERIQWSVSNNPVLEDWVVRD